MSSLTGFGPRAVVWSPYPKTSQVTDRRMYQSLLPDGCLAKLLNVFEKTARFCSKSCHKFSAKICL